MDPCLPCQCSGASVLCSLLGVWLVRGLDCITVAEEAIGKSPGALNAGVSQNSPLPISNTRIACASDLLAFLFMLLSDESPEVAARAVSELNVPPVRGLLPCSPLRYFLGGHTLATSHLQKYIKVVRCGTSLPCVPSVLPRDFACNAAYLVSSAATTLVTLHFQPILNIQLAWLSCWMPPMRLKQCACHMFHLGIVQTQFTGAHNLHSRIIDYNVRGCCYQFCAFL